MDQIEKSIVDSLDGTDQEIYPYLPYILKDIWEIGADPASMLQIIDQKIEKRPLKILDLGCGKGAISIHLARNLDCSILGLDAMPDFVDEAISYSREFAVDGKCTFRVEDIRATVSNYRDYDIIILGAIGTVLGNMLETLQKLKPSLIDKGYVLIDDAWLEDDSDCGYTRCLRKTEFYRQIRDAGFFIIHEELFNRKEIESSDMEVFNKMKMRAEDLASKEPEKKSLFFDYLKSQQYEYLMLAHHLTTGTWLLQKTQS
jgi:cyclopropane fatty-acyl-phospholipid synthase-like methyltransferase